MYMFLVNIILVNIHNLNNVLIRTGIDIVYLYKMYVHYLQVGYCMKLNASFEENYTCLLSKQNYPLDVHTDIAGL